ILFANIRSNSDIASSIRGSLKNFEDLVEKLSAAGANPVVKEELGSATTKEKAGAGKKALPAVEKVVADIKAAGREDLSLFKHIAKLVSPDRMPEGKFSMDIVIEDALVDGRDIDENLETIAVLAVIAGGIGDISVGFSATGAIGEGISEAHAAGTRNETLNAKLREKILSIKGFYDVTPEKLAGIAGMVARGIVPSVGRLQSVLVSGKTLKMLKETGLKLGDNQYPVAMDNSLTEEGLIPVHDFTTAFSLGILNAALVSRAKADDGTVDLKKARDMIRGSANFTAKLTRLSALVFGNHIKITEDTIMNMINPDVHIRMSVALRFILPPVAAGLVQDLIRIHDEMRYALTFA
ncbi:MAG: hypothetical protein HQL28_06080, partial [Candidatus Omnitrophica bacterium]|nr:hypothetical protein [Candidatus Omnitrophota bacterium]